MRCLSHAIERDFSEWSSPTLVLRYDILTLNLPSPVLVQYSFWKTKESALRLDFSEAMNGKLLHCLNSKCLQIKLLFIMSILSCSHKKKAKRSIKWFYSTGCLFRSSNRIKQPNSKWFVCSFFVICRLTIKFSLGHFDICFQCITMKSRDFIHTFAAIKLSLNWCFPKYCP